MRTSIQLHPREDLLLRPQPQLPVRSPLGTGATRQGIGVARHPEL